MLNKDVRDFLLYFYSTLKHPFQQGVEEKIEIGELELALDFLEEVLEMAISEERLQELEPRFNSAFESYINLPRTQIGALCNSIEKLASLLDPFLKKLVYVFYPQKKIHKGNRLIPLWQTSDFLDILEELEISKVSLKCSEEKFWIQQPCDQAILRIAFTTRHKGVHESHRYTLQNFERIAYSTIGSYIVVTLSVMREPSLREKFGEKIERRHFITLLKGKTEAFNTTGSLLSENEHLNIYQYRENIHPTLEEAKFLFINYLASRGPVFFWLQRNNRTRTIKWAMEYLKAHDEVIKRNAMRYLIENGKRFNLRDVVKLFEDYELKVELAGYIHRFSRKEDIHLLISLYKNKAEEVSEAACEALCRFVRKESHPILHKLALSKSIRNQYLFKQFIPRIAKGERLKYYRKFESITDKVKKVIAIYCLGEVGKKRDIILINNWLSSLRRNETFRHAGWYSIGRIASKIKDTDQVVRLIRNRKKDIRIPVFEAITREGIGLHFNYLFSCRSVSEELRYDIISQILERKDLDLIKRYLKNMTLDSNARKLVLAICKHGGADEFDFLLDLFFKYPSKIEFWNHVKVASEISKLATTKAVPRLKRIIDSPEFWEYFGKERSKTKPMPVRNFENLPLVKRIIAATFCKIARKKEIPVLKKLLRHNYEWISLNASLAISRVFDEKELDWLLQEGLSSGKELEQRNIIRALCLLEKRIYHK